MNDDSRPSIYNAYRLADTIVQTADYVIHRIRIGQPHRADEVVKRLAKMDHHTARLLSMLGDGSNSRHWFRSDGRTTLELQITAARRNEAVEICGHHPNALRSVASIAGRLEWAVLTAIMPNGAFQIKCPVPHSDSSEVEWQEMWEEQFEILRVNGSWDELAWIDFSQRCSKVLPKFSSEHINAVLRLEEASAESAIQHSSARGKNENNSKATSPDHAPNSEGDLVGVSQPLTKEAFTVLRVLYRATKLYGVQDIVANAEPSIERDSVTKARQELEREGLAHRPAGKRKGSALTDKGRALAKIICIPGPGQPSA